MQCFIKLSENCNLCDRHDRQTDASDLMICLMLCYSNAIDYITQNIVCTVLLEVLVVHFIDQLSTCMSWVLISVGCELLITFQC